VVHLFQGRYKAILVDRVSHLLELTRYAVLNPLRGWDGEGTRAWPWSRCLAMIGAQPAAPWLAKEGLLAAFGKRRADAVRRYMAFVAEGVGAAPSAAAVVEGHRTAVWGARRGDGCGARQRGYSYQQIGAHFGVRFTKVARVLRRAKGSDLFGASRPGQDAPA
jgi:hypothetical protein